MRTRRRPRPPRPDALFVAALLALGWLLWGCEAPRAYVHCTGPGRVRYDYLEASLVDPTPEQLAAIAAACAVVERGP
jgi:hypothetical protein